MQGLALNWSWILIAVAVVAFFFLRRGHRSHGGSDYGGRSHAPFDKAGDLGHHNHHDPEPGERGAATWPQPPEAVVDPVSGIAVRTADAITSIYAGKAYYFASKEDRDRFEAAPQDYANKVQGIPIGGHDSAARPRRRHHGC